MGQFRKLGIQLGEVSTEQKIGHSYAPKVVAIKVPGAFRLSAHGLYDLREGGSRMKDTLTVGRLSPIVLAQGTRTGVASME
jgi:hypothetical protein